MKVVVLAGSIGAFRGQSYAAQLQGMCRRVEIKNLSKVGVGAWGLKKRFRDQVLKNRRLRLSAPELEHWVVYAGGLNSVGSPERTNRYTRDLFVLAHSRGMKVVALSLTPWGSERDRRRWAGVAGIKYRRATQKVVDFVMGRLTPREALGVHAGRRPQGPDAPWAQQELPDVAVDLYDSRLRDRDAAPRDLESMKALIAKDKGWQKAHAGLSPDERARVLERDAEWATNMPRWYLRPELRAFDHIHLNADGHRLVAEIACPALPESWDCDCPPAPTAAPPPTGPRAPLR